MAGARRAGSGSRRSQREETAAARRKGETRRADAKAKSMEAFHVRLSVSLAGLLAFLWAIGLLYLQLTYMGLGALELEGPVPPHYSNPPGPGLKPLFGMSQQFLSSVAQYGAASHQLKHFGDGCILWRTFIPGWPALSTWHGKRQLGPMMIRVCFLI